MSPKIAFVLCFLACALLAVVNAANYYPSQSHIRVQYPQFTYPKNTQEELVPEAPKPEEPTCLCPCANAENPETTTRNEIIDDGYPNGGSFNPENNDNEVPTYSTNTVSTYIKM